MTLVGPRLEAPFAVHIWGPQQGSFRPVGEDQDPRSGTGGPGAPGIGSGGPTGSLSRAVCAPHEFQCSNRSCLAAVFVCDGDDDCGDGSDERGCADPACGPREFRCSGDSGIAGLTRARRQLPVEIDLFRTPYAPAYQWPFWGGI